MATDIRIPVPTAIRRTFSYTPTHYVDIYTNVSGSPASDETDQGATAWSNATSASSPTTLGTALARATAGDVVEMAAGTYTGTSSASRNTATWQPTNSGTSGNKIIFYAANPAAHNAINRTQLSNGVTAQDNTGGATFGVSATDYFVWDGIYVDESTSQYHTDSGPCILWDTTGSELRRCFVENDGNQVHTPADNHSCYRFEVAHGCTITDCKGTGSYSATNRYNGSCVITYDCTDMELQYCEFYSAHGGVFIKGMESNQSQHTWRIHHNYVHDVDVGITIANVSPNGSGTTGSYGAHVYQNIVENIDDGIVTRGYDSPMPEGVVIANNLVVDQKSTSNAALYVKFGFTGTDDPCVWRNNIALNFNRMVYIEALTSIAEVDMDDHMYHNFTSEFGYYEGGAGGYATLALWNTALTPIDDNSEDSDPLFEDEAGGDYRLSGTSPALNAGTDYLNLLGGGTSASINYGPYINAAQSETIGVRPVDEISY